MPDFRLTNSMTIFTVIAMMLCFALALPAVAAGEEESALTAEYSIGAKRCLACHRKIKKKKSAHDTFLTSLDPSVAPAFPTADGKHYCEACHGPAAAHTKKQAGGGRVPPPMTFSQEQSAQEKNNVCLACHDDQPDFHWTGSRHEARDTACADCHIVHAQYDPDAEHVVMKCINCHLQDADTLAGQSRKARDFHKTTMKNDLSCSRCHGGVAHGVPDWITDIRAQQQQTDD